MEVVVGFRVEYFSLFRVITLNSEKNASARELLLRPLYPEPRILNTESVYLLFWIAEFSRSAFGRGEASAGVSGVGEARSPRSPRTFLKTMLARTRTLNPRSRLQCSAESELTAHVSVNPSWGNRDKRYRDKGSKKTRLHRCKAGFDYSWVARISDY